MPLINYRLRDNLSYCVIGQHAVFLDVETDRYFTLPGPMERAFLAHIGAPDRVTAPSELVACGLLVESEQADAAANEIEVPLRSALEMPSPRAHPGFGTIAEVMITLLACRRNLRTRPLKDILKEAAKHRDSRCVPEGEVESSLVEMRLVQNACIFDRARRYIPVDTCCLPDSLALLRFLARRALPGNIVFAVTHDPFSAHCWIQFRDIALNETVGAAMAHTVIRVV